MSSARSRKWGHQNRHDCQAVVEILAKSAFLDLLQEIAMGGHQDAREGHYGFALRRCQRRELGSYALHLRLPHRFDGFLKSPYCRSHAEYG